MNSSPRVRIVTSDVPAGTGWDTVTLLAQFAAHVLEGELVLVPGDRALGRGVRAASLLPRRRGADVTLVIATDPGALYHVIDRHHVIPGDSLVAGWVIDSFWTDRIPRIARGHFDHFFITDGELVADWERVSGVPVHFLPFGSDVLGAPRAAGRRTVDIQRVGRQPRAWDDEARLLTGAQDRGLVARGRVPFHTSAVANQRELLGAMREARFTLSFSNAVSPDTYTHPSREYLTGRWTDALAQGATVAGAVPNCMATATLLWPDATLAIPADDLDAGLDVLRDATSSWSADLAVHHQAMALRRLDWRWRLLEIARVLELSSATLDHELSCLDQAVRRTAADAGSA